MAIDKRASKILQRLAAALRHHTFTEPMWCKIWYAGRIVNLVIRADFEPTRVPEHKFRAQKPKFTKEQCIRRAVEELHALLHRGINIVELHGLIIHCVTVENKVLAIHLYLTCCEPAEPVNVVRSGPMKRLSNETYTACLPRRKRK